MARMQLALPALRFLPRRVGPVLTVSPLRHPFSGTKHARRDGELPQRAAVPAVLSKAVRKHPYSAGRGPQPCSVRGGRARSPRASAPGGLATGRVHPCLLLLLGEGLPHLPVLPAAVQQGEAVLGHVGQGLGGVRQRELLGCWSCHRPLPRLRSRPALIPGRTLAGRGVFTCYNMTPRKTAGECVRAQTQGKHSLQKITALNWGAGPA